MTGAAPAAHRWTIRALCVYGGRIISAGDKGMIQENVNQAVEAITTYGLHVIGGIIILVVGWIAAGWSKKMWIDRLTIGTSICDFLFKCATRNALDRIDLTKAFEEALDAAGISIPVPQRDVHLFEAKAAA